MDYIIGALLILSLISVIALIIGLFDPTAVLPSFIKNRNKEWICFIYIPLAIISFLLAGILIPALTPAEAWQRIEESESARKDLFDKIYKVYIRAEDEGDRLNPTDDISLSLEEMERRIEAARDYSDKIKQEFNKTLETKYQITRDQIDKIVFEGLKKKWHKE